ncbi:MAG: TIGR02757 family protein [Desulfuromonadaceae bacterium]|nr:TIGR02757 family protein [Desulfuromonadaceae bacterium]MDD2853913.1 TIGR02757 family protein [Desulfuromonadaceae bacterium]
MSDIKGKLNQLYANRSLDYLSNDPLSFCHRYSNQADQEIAAIIASSFAYGNVKIILRTLDKIFAELGASPVKYIESFDPKKGLKTFSGFKHRFNDGRDLCALLAAIKQMIERKGSIQSFFMQGHSPKDNDVSNSLNSYITGIMQLEYSDIFGGENIPADSYFSFLFPSPSTGSACKRLCMMLRWLVRPADGIDLGIWKGISPAQLIIPVDTHISRISRYLGFTERKSADWRMAQEITATLKGIDPDDPVKYDFALAHLGISAGCDGTNLDLCESCSIASVCKQSRKRWK